MFNNLYGFNLTKEQFAKMFNSINRNSVDLKLTPEQARESLARIFAINYGSYVRGDNMVRDITGGEAVNINDARQVEILRIEMMLENLRTVRNEAKKHRLGLSLEQEIDLVLKLANGTDWASISQGLVGQQATTNLPRIQN